MAILLLCLTVTACSSQPVKKEFFENGQLRSKTSLKGDKFDGPVEAYYSDGRLAMTGQNVNNKTDGVWKHWYHNGKPSSTVRYDHGVIVDLNAWDSTGVQTVTNCSGTAYLYHPNGSRKIQQSYKNCRPDGSWTSWYENGKVESEKFFTDGKETGIWKFWSKEGLLVKEERH
jgi:antitoxin component YwqK of YwqJK toxin-antitoxin module